MNSSSAVERHGRRQPGFDERERQTVHMQPVGATGQRGLGVRHGNRWVTARLGTIDHRLDIQDLWRSAVSTLAVSEIGRVQIELHEPLPLAPYAANRVGGSLIVVDPATHRTSGALPVLSDATAAP